MELWNLWVWWKAKVEIGGEERDNMVGKCAWNKWKKVELLVEILVMQVKHG